MNDPSYRRRPCLVHISLSNSHNSHNSHKLFLASVFWKYTLILSEEEISNLPFVQKRETFGKTALGVRCTVSVRFMLSLSQITSCFLPVFTVQTGGPLWVIYFHYIIVLIDVPESLGDSGNSITQTIF